MTFIRQGYEQHVQVSDTMPLILIIDPFSSAGLGRQTQPGFTDQGASPFIVAQGSLGIQRLLVDPTHLPYRPHNRNQPAEYTTSLAARASVLFLSVCRTVSYETVSTTPSCTNLPANSRKLQCACPSGAFVQAVASMWLPPACFAGWILLHHSIKPESALQRHARFWPCLRVIYRLRLDSTFGLSLPWVASSILL